MHIDTRDLLQGRFAVANVSVAGSRLLLLSDQMLGEGLKDDILDVGRGNTRDRPDRCSFGFAMQVRKRDVIAIADAGLGRMGRNHAMTDIVEQKSGQQMVARVPRRGPSSPLIRELLLDRIKQRAIHYRWLFTG